MARRVQAAWPDACLHAVAQAFRAACGNGHEGVAKWLWTERRASIEGKNGFVRACRKGRLLLAKWLWTEVRVPVPFVADAFVEACSKGHLRVAQWLWALGHVEQNGPLTGVFWKACLGGHLAVAQWLWRVSRDPVDVTIHNYCALRGAAKHPCMLPWVWSLARDVVPDVIMASVFESACGKGDLAVIPWLWDVCSVHSKPHMLSDGFVHACDAGHLEAAQWLWANDAVQTEDVQVALHAACTEGHLRVVWCSAVAAPLTKRHSCRPPGMVFLTLPSGCWTSAACRAMCRKPFDVPLPMTSCLLRSGCMVWGARSKMTWSWTRAQARV